MDRQRGKFYETLIQDLVAFSKRYFRLSSRAADGHTLREHLEAAEKARNGVTRGLIAKFKPPTGSVIIWQWYIDISSTRQLSMGSPMPITHAEIYAWSMLYGITLEPWHVRAIKLLDAAHLNALLSSGEEVTLEELVE